MSIEIKGPVLPESVVDALLLDWNKQVGDAVKRDEILVEVETDKVVLEVTAPEDGILTEIIEQSGAIVFSEHLLAKIESAHARSQSEPVFVVEPDSKPESKPKVEKAPVNKDKKEAPVKTTADQSEPLSPAVRRLIDENDVDVAAISGSGHNGRITKQDVMKYLADTEAPSEPTQSATEADAPAAMPEIAAQPKTVVIPKTSATKERQETREPMSRLRQTIAKRLVQSQQSAALLTTFNEVNMQAVMAIRSKYKEEFEKKHGAKLGFMSFFAKASAVALQRFPLVNAYIDGTDIVQHNYNDIGIAVSSPRGLVVPVLRNCEALSYAEIEAQIQDFGVRAKQGKIDLAELIGGTFTLTNGGVFGSLLSTPIVNPPQSAILGMHKIQQRPIAENDEVVIRPMMYLALSYDHRIIDGQEAVRFLVTVKEVLEDPTRLLLDI